MTGLVEQLQAEALNPSVSVSTLLRKVKVAAVKLRLEDTVEWADKELKGYTESVPPYRIARGRCMGFNPYHGWSVVGGDAKVVDALSQRAIGQAISSLEELVTGEKDQLMISLPAKTANSIKSNNPACHDVALFISQADLTAMIDHVRNLVLDWALDLEKAGIMGEGLSFTPLEQQKAASTSMNIKIDGPNARLNIGSIDHSSNSN